MKDLSSLLKLRDAQTTDKQVPGLAVSGTDVRVAFRAAVDEYKLALRAHRFDHARDLLHAMLEDVCAAPDEFTTDAVQALAMHRMHVEEAERVQAMREAEHEEKQEMMRRRLAESYQSVLAHTDATTFLESMNALQLLTFGAVPGRQVAHAGHVAGTEVLLLVFTDGHFAVLTVEEDLDGVATVECEEELVDFEMALHILDVCGVLTATKYTELTDSYGRQVQTETEQAERQELERLQAKYGARG